MEKSSPRAEAFLISDIRGYSRFTTERGAAAAGQLAATFTGLGRDAIAARCGRVLGLRGDEILATFATAGSAVRAALDLQAACREASAESPGFPLNAGVGLDLGEAVAVDDAYHGAAINLASRLCSRARAGQVLVTEAIVAAAAGEPDLRFASVGTAELKGFPNPVEMFGAAPARDDATCWIPGPPTPLPNALDDHTPMAGREPDLSWLRGVWRQARRGAGRVVLLTGPAGMGKTRLAAALASFAATSGSPVRYSGTGGGAGGAALAAVGEARDGTGLWIIDELDLHLEAAAALNECVSSIAARPALVVGICRDAGRDVVLAALAERLDRDESGVRDLGPLDLEDVRAVGRHYADDIDDLPAESILRASAGIPAAVHEMVAQWAGAEARRRLVAAAEWLAEGRSRQASGLRFADNVIVANLRRIYDPGGASAGEAANGDGGGPYKGLNAFEESDAAWFFGREQLVGELAARTVGYPLVAVVGPSGSGKSSAVLAGLVPSLKAGLLPGSEHWSYAMLRPGHRPVASLDAALASVVADRPAGSTANRLVLVIDQFEEIFAPGAGEQAKDFVDRLIRLTEDRSPAAADVVVVVTVRADYVGHCAPYPELAERVAANLVLVGPMTDDQLRRAIEAPARKLGVHVESRLVDELVGEVTGEPGGLPLLSTALVELWRERQGRWIRFEAYQRLGGVRNAVARLAENSYEQMDDGQRAATRSIFLRLVDAGDGEPAVRRRVKIAEFDLDDDPTRAGALSVLVRDRLLTRDDDQVEIAHEALIREWPRLGAWLSEDSAGRTLRSQLTQSARQWDERGRDPADLYQGARLLSALDWWNAADGTLNAIERGFLVESREVSRRRLEGQRRANRRLRLLLTGTAVFLVLALAAGLFALVQRDHARAEQRSAQRQALRSDAERVGALAQTESNLDLSLLLAVAGVELDDRPATRGDLLAALQRAPSAYRFIRPSTNAITAIAISPDGTLMATGDSAGAVRFENLRTWTQRGPAIRLPGPVPPNGLTFAPGGGTLAVATGSGITAEVFAITVATRQRRLLGTWTEAIPPIPNGSTTVAFSPDGTKLAVGLSNWTTPSAASPVSSARVALLDASTGKVVWTRPYPVVKGQLEEQVAFTRAGTLVTSAEGGVTDLWNAASGTVVRKFPIGGRFALSPDGHQAAVAVNRAARGALYTSVELLDLTTGHRRTLQAVPASTWMATLQYTPDGAALVGGSLDGYVRVWDVSSGALEETYASGSGGRTPVAVDPSGRTAVSGADDGSVIAWALSGGQAFGRTFAWSTPGNSCPAGPCFTVNPAGTVMATDESDGTVDLVDLRTLKWYATLRGTAGRPANGLAFTPRGQLVTGDSAGTVRVWDIATRRVVRRVQVAAPVYDVAVRPDGRQLAVLMQRTGAAAAEVEVIDLATGAPIRTYSLPDGSGGLAYSPDGRALVALGCCSPGSVVDVWDASSGRPLPSPAYHGQAQSIAFSPTAPVLGIGTADGEIYRWNTATAAAAGPPLNIAASNVLQFTYSADGRLLAASLRDGSTRLIDVASGQQLGASFPIEGATLTAPLFTAKNDLLINYVGTATEWPTSLAAWERAACQLAGRDITRAEWAAILPDRPYRHVCPS